MICRSRDHDITFFKYTRINNHAIKLINDQQLSYKLIYSFKPLELKILKIYIEFKLANAFIKPFKLPASDPIFFDQKSNGFFQLCINYKSPNNFTIKNQYLLLLVRKLLDRLDKVRQFTQLDLINAYYQIRICKNNK